MVCAYGYASSVRLFQFTQQLTAVRHRLLATFDEFLRAVYATFDHRLEEAAQILGNLTHAHIHHIVISSNY